jgi:transcriptional regulator with XRE-family HTH domain
VTTLSKTKRKLLDDLKDVETRQIFQSEHNAAAIPIQIRELRKKRKLTQKKLGELTGMDQATISDLENPNYEYTPQIGTLERLANAYDVPLIVRFGSWSELWDWEHNLTAQRLAPGTFDEALPEIEASIQRETIEQIVAAPGSGKTMLFMEQMKIINTITSAALQGYSAGVQAQAQTWLEFMQPQPLSIAAPISTPAEVIDLGQYKSRYETISVKNPEEDEERVA